MNRKIFINSILFIWLNVIDIGLTLIAINKGCIECNSMFNIALNIHSGVFIVLKMLLVSGIIIFYNYMYKINNNDIKQLTIQSILLINLFMLLICINNLYWVIL